MSIGKFTNYNDLVEPNNPYYPWNPTFWQPLCYYCAQPIRVKHTGAMHKQRVGCSWEHINPIFITDIDIEKHPEIKNLKFYQNHLNGSHHTCKNLKFYQNHLNGSHHTCNPLYVRPTDEIDDPRCHICGTQTNQHRFACSAAGKPSHTATTMSQKEDELIRIFGWTNKTLEKKKEKVSLIEGTGALALIASLAWVTKILLPKKLDVK